MIYVNGVKVKITRFPDGTPSFRLDVNPYYGVRNITWRYDGDEECMAIWNIVHHVRGKAPGSEIELHLPYIPNARMDRVKNSDEIFTLKWFAEFLNSLHFKRVYVYDAHSNVSLALIDRVENKDPACKVNHAVSVLEGSGINLDELIFCYPDEGAAKRYGSMFDYDFVTCMKHRDWRTGAIEDISLNEPEKVRGKYVLIVDDICSRGGTFLLSALKLKEAGAEKVFLFVSHCENTILDGGIPGSDLIDRVFTTDSLYRGCLVSVSGDETLTDTKNKITVL